MRNLGMALTLLGVYGCSDSGAPKPTTDPDSGATGDLAAEADLRTPVDLAGGPDLVMAPDFASPGDMAGACADISRNSFSVGSAASMLVVGAPMPVKIENRGPCTMMVTQVSLFGPGAPDFALKNIPKFPVALPVGASLTFEIVALVAGRTVDLVVTSDVMPAGVRRRFTS